MQLVIGNKNYSSWSMRPWVLMRQAGIPFEEVLLRLDFDPGSDFKKRLATLGVAGKVPVLIDDARAGDAGWAIWDTLAIAETLAERFPEKGLWPADARLRARARSLCAEMHSGFGALRQHCPMNIEARLPEIGERVLAGQEGVRADLARIDAIFTACLAASGGPMLFGGFGIVDAFYAPVCSRIRTYGLPMSAPSAAYVDRVHDLAALREWTAAALAEHDFLPFDEPYRKAPAW